MRKKKTLQKANSRFSWEKGFDRNFILKKIDECRNVADGKCSFVGSEYPYWKPVLSSAIRADNMSRAAKQNCIGAALNDAACSLTNHDKFLDRCNLEYRKLSERGGREFVVYFTVTYDGPKLLNWISDDGTRLYWQPSANSALLNKCKLARTELSSLLKSRNVPDDVENLTDILIRVDAFNFYEAMEKARHTVSKLLGIINLIANGSRGLPTFAGFSLLMKPRAINCFRLGPFHTVHDPTGKLFNQMYWYEPNWIREGTTTKFSGDPAKTRKDILGWWRKCQSSPLKELIGLGLRRYSDALDLANVDETLLGLWSTVEHITRTQNHSYDETILRLRRLSGDNQEAVQVAEHIRYTRNSFVHAANSVESDQALVIGHQAEWLVRILLGFIIKHGSNFKSVDDYSDFLKLRGDAGGLKRQAELISIFIRIREG